MKEDANSKDRRSFRDTGGSALRQIFCPRMGVVLSAGSEMSSETKRLLAFRLMIVAGVFAFSSGLYALRSILLPDSEGICLHQQIIALGIFLVSALILNRNQTMSLRTLRFFEFLIFGGDGGSPVSLLLPLELGTN